METPNIQEINKAGIPYVQMPKKDYISLLEHIEDLEDIEAVHEVRILRKHGEEVFPIEIITRITDGTHPVKIYRKYRGFTQQALADKASINRVYLAEIENGKKPGSAYAL